MLCDAKFCVLASTVVAVVASFLTNVGVGVAQYEHKSAVLGCNMVVSVIDPSCHLNPEQHFSGNFRGNPAPPWDDPWCGL